MVEGISPERFLVEVLERELFKVIGENSYRVTRDSSKRISIPNETIYEVKRGDRLSEKALLRIVRGGPCSAISGVSLDCQGDSIGIFWALGYALDSFAQNKRATYPWLTVTTPFNGREYIEGIRRRHPGRDRSGDEKADVGDLEKMSYKK
ncbi:MAG: hypothetical protein NUV97_04300 [archaeon]|nr:hypothetical protein [archaeon]MCR4323528.1 hypothetical protein [Nanoarchaeota archaeon]